MRGHELQEIRLKMHKSQEQMAAALGVSGRTISRWEVSDLPIPYEAVQRLQTMHLDDDRSLARVSAKRLLDELMTRASLWDAAGLTGDMPAGPRLRAVATGMEDLDHPEKGDDTKAP